MGPSAGFIGLPSVTYTDMAAGNYAYWWGQTGTFLNPVARAVAFQGFYNGIIDNVSNFFAGDSPEVNWYRESDGSYFPLTHSQFVGGDIPLMPGGGVFKATRVDKGIKVGKSISHKNAIAKLRIRRKGVFHVFKFSFQRSHSLPRTRFGGISLL
ncbi:hypothetical protein [Pleomorphovibrio marinus]|uniref:hypothetical protein n=1 Tax=Pleomorphovibrio marinus TaxID=2164132 RepID=UPI000E0B1788|nr:hypothetical protein [Pleomorphovibrio marinus]